MATSPDRGRRSRLRLKTLIRWFWYFESAPVSADEILLRAIPNVQGYFTADGMGNWAVNPYAFRPNRARDPDGISFFRDDFESPLAVASKNRHPVGVRIAQIRMVDLASLNLDAIPDPIADGLCGHVIVPRMRFADNLTPQEKRFVKENEEKLARFATLNGVLNPLDLPNPSKRQTS